jgi:hypothetical protein
VEPDYQDRANAPRTDVSAAMEKLTQAIDYDNFKNAVASRQDYNRASLYGKVWSILYNLSEKQGEPLMSNLNTASGSEILQDVYKKSVYPSTCLNDEGELIDVPCVCHPDLMIKENR